MQLLRITRATNDSPPLGALCCLGFIFLVLLILALVSAMWGRSSLVHIGLTAWLGYGLIRVMLAIRFPHEVELVIEQDRMRYGRTDRPGKQRVIPRGGVKGVCLDENPGARALTVKTGRFRCHELPPFLLRDAERRKQVIEAIRRHWPEVMVREKPPRRNFVERIALMNGRFGYAFTIFWYGGIGAALGTCIGGVAAVFLGEIRGPGMDEDTTTGLLVLLGAWLGFWWAGSFCRRRLQMLIRCGETGRPPERA